MDTTMDQVVVERPHFVEQPATPAPADVQAQARYRSRIRFDGFFTGPTW
jgi:hypothetical protein